MFNPYYYGEGFGKWYHNHIQDGKTRHGCAHPKLHVEVTQGHVEMTHLVPEWVRRLKRLGFQSANASGISVNGDSKLGFGKFADRTYVDVKENEPDYCSWVVEQLKENPGQPQGPFRDFAIFCQEDFGRKWKFPSKCNSTNIRTTLESEFPSTHLQFPLQFSVSLFDDEDKNSGVTEKGSVTGASVGRDSSTKSGSSGSSSVMKTRGAVKEGSAENAVKKQTVMKKAGPRSTISMKKEPAGKGKKKVVGVTRGMKKVAKKGGKKGMKKVVKKGGKKEMKKVVKKVMKKATKKVMKNAMKKK